MPFLRPMLSVVLLAAFSAAATAKPITLSAETNLRKAPGTKSEALGLMPKGAEVEVGDCDAGWCKVTWDGREGYAIGRNLGMEQPREAAAPRQPQQADMNRLRRGYEQYFDGQAQAADQGAESQQRQYMEPQQRQYADRRAQQQQQQQQQQYDDDDDGIVYGTPPSGYVPVGPRPYYYNAPPAYYYGPRVYYGPGPGPYYYRRW